VRLVLGLALAIGLPLLPLPRAIVASGDALPPRINASSDQCRHNLGAYLVHPYNFRIKECIAGQGFHPAERVKVAAVGIPGDATQATADSHGYFSAALPMPISWVFCGPAASRGGAPSFIAIGNMGSEATTEEESAACPTLSVFFYPKSPPPQSQFVPMQVRAYGFKPKEFVTLRTTSFWYPNATRA
jgi:hypothetical protein